MDKHTARQNTIRCYANRIMGKMLQYPVDVSGDFDCKEVADSVPIPTTAELSEHEVCWERLYTAFAMKWAQI